MDSRDLPDVVRAVTLPRPWPWAITEGRLARAFSMPHPVPRRMVGSLLAIHASSREWEPETNTAIRRFTPSPQDPERHLCGLVGVVRVTGDWPLEQARRALRRGPGKADGSGRPYIARSLDTALFTGPWLWLFDEVRAIEPIPCRGSKTAWRGLWRLKPARADALRARLEVRLADIAFGQGRMV